MNSVTVVKVIRKARQLVDLIQDLKDTMTEDAYNALLQQAKEIEDTINEDEVPF